MANIPITLAPIRTLNLQSAAATKVNTPASAVPAAAPLSPGLSELSRGLRGLPGIKGDKGDCGGSQYIHTQALPLAVWTVPHNLDGYPFVVVADTLGNVVVADVTYIDSNIVRITHGSAFSGFAYCS